MYKTSTLCETGFIVKTNTDGFDYNLDKNKVEGTTPVGLLSSALCGCITMCVRGYFIKNKLESPVIEVVSELEDRTFNIKTYINKEVTDLQKIEILDYVEELCTVSKMLSGNVEINNEIVVRI